MTITIKLDRKKSLRLGRHLEREHPSTKGKILINDKKIAKRRENKMVVKKAKNIRTARKRAAKARKKGFKATIFRVKGRKPRISIRRIK